MISGRILRPEMNRALRVAAVSLIRELPDFCQFWRRRGLAQSVKVTQRTWPGGARRMAE